jgi:hypothetical protein
MVKGKAGSIAGALLLLMGAPAQAQPFPSGTRLSYFRAMPGAESCPDEQSFRDVVSSRMKGADPFTPNGAQLITVSLARRGRGFVGALALFDSAGTQGGSRELSGATCGAVVDDAATAISLVLQSLPAPVVAPAPPGIVRPSAAVPEITRPIDRAPPSRRPDLRLGAGLTVAGGFAPAASLGFVGLVGVRWPWFSLDLEGRGDLPSTGNPMEGFSPRTAFAGAAVTPCVHVSWFIGCGLVTLGGVRGETEPKLAAEAKGAFFAATGPRAGLEIPLVPHLALQITGDMQVTLARPTVRAGGREIGGSSAFAEAAGLRVITFF